MIGAAYPGQLYPGGYPATIGAGTPVDCTIATSQAQSVVGTCGLTLDSTVATNQAQSVTIVCGLTLNCSVSTAQGQSLTGVFALALDSTLSSSQGQSLIGICSVLTVESFSGGFEVLARAGKRKRKKEKDIEETIFEETVIEDVLLVIQKPKKPKRFLEDKNLQKFIALQVEEAKTFEEQMARLEDDVLLLLY